MDPQAALLLRKATEDRGALDYEFLSDAIFGFHAQQAFEKLFKALIASRDVRYVRTHILADLLRQLDGLGEQGLPLPYPVLSLQPYALLLRYDDGNTILPVVREQRRDAIDLLTAYVGAQIDL